MKKKSRQLDTVGEFSLSRVVIAHDIEVEIPAVAPISAIVGISTSVS